jgi:hypothetical protein
MLPAGQERPALSRQTADAVRRISGVALSQGGTQYRDDARILGPFNLRETDHPFICFRWLILPPEQS